MPDAATSSHIAHRAIASVGDQPLVRVAEVRKEFANKELGTVTALEEVDLEIRQGEVVALLGPSGCGKSTLLRLMAGLLKPSSGSVEFRGQNVGRPVTDIGVVFQSPVLMDWLTVMGNIRLQGRCRQLTPSELDEAAGRLIEMVGLNGFEGRRPYELSGGMQQRVALCRALVHKPPLLLMDEPFGALDALTRDQIAVDVQPVLAEAEAGVVLVTHSIAEAVLLADKVCVFTPRPGRIARVFEVPLTRPRTLEVRASPTYVGLVDEITRLFGELGVLR